MKKNTHTPLRIQVDRSLAIPLYQQLAGILRLKILSGELEAGARLPALRPAAREWGVNLHTVRRAYAELDGEGLARTTPTVGTTVVDLRGESGALDHYLTTLLKLAEHRFGMAASELAERLLYLDSGGRGPDGPVHVVECSRTLADVLAGEVTQHWGVPARSWLLSEAAALPPGVVVSTYFHFTQLRARLPDRIADMVFLRIRPDYDLIKRCLEPYVGSGPVVLCDTDYLDGHAMGADLRAHLGEEVRFDIQTPDDPEELLAKLPDSTPILCSPGSWDRLTREGRNDPRAFLLPIRVDEDDLRQRDPVGLEYG